MMRTRAAVCIIAAGALLSACGRDKAPPSSDSAAVADSARAEKSATAADSTAAVAPAAVNSVKPPLGSTAGTIGETRKNPRGVLGRDSAVQGPYHTIDSAGTIKR